jgi:phosphoglycerate dehydrogenase-like enzyme
MPLFVFLPPPSRPYPQGPQLIRRWARRLATQHPSYSFLVCETEGEALVQLPQATAAFGTLSPRLLSSAPHLRWLQAPQADPPPGYFFEELAAHPVVVTNFRGVYSDHIGAHVMAYVLALARRLDCYLLQQPKREWLPASRSERVVHLPAATALVVGVGAVGERVSQLCSAFGMSVLGIDARRTELATGMKRIAGPDALDDLLPLADFVILTVPQTPKTRGLIDRGRLKLMKSTAFLINVGRGATVCLGALLEALEEGDIAGAALDVFEDEPLPAEHALWTMRRVIITPHVAVNGPHLETRWYEVLSDNMRLFIEGRPLRNVVDKSEGY